VVQLKEYGNSGAVTNGLVISEMLVSLLVRRGGHIRRGGSNSPQRIACPPQEDTEDYQGETKMLVILSDFQISNGNFKIVPKGVKEISPAKGRESCFVLE